MNEHFVSSYFDQARVLIDDRMNEFHVNEVVVMLNFGLRLSVYRWRTPPRSQNQIEYSNPSPA